MRETGGAAGMSGSGILAVGVAMVALMGVGAYFGLRDLGAPTEENLSALTPQADVVAPQDVTEPEGADAAPSDPEPVPANTAPDAQIAPMDPAPEVIATLSAPTIDEVRVEADGLIIVAGRADPGSVVRVLVDGMDITQADADGRGAFAALGIVSPSSQARVISLIAQKDDQLVASLEEVILAPIAAPQIAAIPEDVTPAPTDEPADAQGSAELAVIAQAKPVVETPDAGPQVENEDAQETVQQAAPQPELQTAPDATKEVVQEAEPQTSSQPDTVATTPQGNAVEPEPAQVPETVTTVITATPVNPDTPVSAPEIESAPVPQIATAPDVPALPETGDGTQVAPTGPSAVAVLKSTSEGVSLLQTAPEPAQSITLDTIGYSDSGVVQLAGRASLQAEGVNIYLDNRAVLSLPVQDNGSWRGEVPNVAAGVYTLRVDAIDENGAVTSRLETPFKREAPAVLAQASQDQSGPVKAITVQTGDTLWAIARDRYGEGVLFVRVFDANRASIVDPDLIYPGQVFDLPLE